MLKQVMLWILGLVKLDELGKNMIEYTSTNLLCFYILIILVILLTFSVAYALYRKICKRKVDVMVLISIIATILSCSALYVLMESYNSMCRDYYAEAEKLCKDCRYQDAKVLYQKISGHRDSLEKMAECDFQSAQYYLQNSKYAEAYELLFPWLAYPDETEGIAALEDMRQLLTEGAEQVSVYCKKSSIFQDLAWMLGKWSDEKGNYCLFRMRDNKESYFFEQNIDNASKISVSRYRAYENGIYWVSDDRDEGWTCAIIFCPISNNSAYVYNIFSGQMFLLDRE